MQYLNLIRYILDHGALRIDRTNTGTRSVFGTQMRFSLANGSFPLLTTKKVFLRGIVEELLWFIHGSTDGRILKVIAVCINSRIGKECSHLGGQRIARVLGPDRLDRKRSGRFGPDLWIPVAPLRRGVFYTRCGLHGSGLRPTEGGDSIAEGGSVQPSYHSVRVESVRTE